MPTRSAPAVLSPSAAGSGSAVPASTQLECDDRIIVALEQEYGVSGQQSNGEQAEMRGVAGVILQQLKVDLPWLPDEHDHEGAAFYPWGGRGYIDCGHAELTSGEAGSPAQLLVQAFAMHQAIAAAAENASNSERTLQVSASSVCYHNRTTFGSHLNNYVEGHFLTHQEQAYQALLPFFASRILLGSGGFDCTRQETPGFVLSPRSCFICTDVGSDSTGARPLIHTRGESEPLSETGSRLHDIALEALISPYASYLRFATTSLVVALIDRGHKPRRLPAFRTRASEAMQAWNHDPDLDKRVASSVGKVGILDVQRCYLDFVAAHLKDAPSFAEECLELWASLLDGLEQAKRTGFDDPVLIERLDWVRKRFVFERFLDTRGGGNWDLERLGKVLKTVKLQSKSRRGRSPSGMIRLLAAQQAALENGESVPKPPPEKPQKLNPDQRKACEFRTRLYALDTQYFDLANPGFGQVRWELPELGIGQEQIDAVLDGSAAAATPTRCRTRGHFIQLWGKEENQRRSRAASWGRIVDNARSRILSMADPFINHAPVEDDDTAWTPHDTPLMRPPRRQESPPVRTGPDFSQRIQQGLNAYDNGRLGEADGIMQAIYAQGSVQGGSRSCLLRYWSWIKVRLGFFEEAIDLLRELYGNDRDPATVSTFRELLAFLMVYKHAGLSAAPRRDGFGAWVEAGNSLTRDRHLRDHSDLAAFLGHRCLWETFVAGDKVRGLRSAVRAAAMEALGSLQPFPRQRIWQSAARVQIANHRFDEAEALLERAAATCLDNDFRGEMALVHILRGQSSYAQYRRGERMQLDALEHFREADTLTDRGPHANPVTRARTQASLARLFGPDDTNNELRREFVSSTHATRNGLRDPLCQTILDHWDEWVAGEPAPLASETGDLFEPVAPTGFAESDPDWWGL